VVGNPGRLSLHRSRQIAGEEDRIGRRDGIALVGMAGCTATEIAGDGARIVDAE